MVTEINKKDEDHDIFWADWPSCLESMLKSQFGFLG